jgi:SAM-dependent methyltransferase
VIDIGCGNNSPAQTKALINCHYIGIDVGDYHQSSAHLADEYVICTPETFNDTLGRYESRADIVISSHNLEHCVDPDRTLDLMCRMLKPGGRMFLAFPCEESVNFPRRRGTLNFYDDASHRTVPSFAETQRKVQALMLTPYACRRYQPAIPYWIGFALEPLSALLKRVMPLRSTWAYYGFESIIWAYKPASGGGDGGSLAPE